MSDRTTADDIVAAFADARPIFADAFHADRYALIRVAMVSDGRGGRKPAETVVEMGRCSLSVANRLGAETEGAVAGEAVAPYSVELPIDSAVTADDLVRITARGEDRTFRVIGPPRRGGEMELFTVADLEESNRP